MSMAEIELRAKSLGDKKSHIESAVPNSKEWSHAGLNRGP